MGASGSVGRRIVNRLLDGGYEAACQTRTASKLADFEGRADVFAFDPRQAARLSEFVRGVDAVIFALGIDSLGATTLFSETTAALIDAMKTHGVGRLIVITGIGAGETRGHGGFVYDRIIFPLFTSRRYADKDRQEDQIAASDLEWTIVRPAPFSERPVTGDLEVHTTIKPGTRLTRVARDEVAAFVVAQLDSDRYLYQRPFIGHP